MVGACSFNPPNVITSAGPVAGGRLVEAVVGTAGTLNPLFAIDDNARDVDQLVYQGLVSVDASQTVVGLLAKAWTVSDDRLSYTYSIRDDVRWADGQPLTVDDVIFTFKVLDDPAYVQPDAQFWKDVKIEQSGEGQVRFTLMAPSASFPLALRLGILPKHVFEGVSPAVMSNDVHSGAKAFGSGPFMVDTISADHKTVTLKRNPYANPKPYLDQFVLHAYATFGDAVDAVSRGQADAVGDVQPPQLAALANRPDLAIFEAKTYGFAGVFFDLTPDLSVYFNPPAVRQALVQAVDRKKIVAAVLGGHADPADGPIPPTDWAYSRTAAESFPYDPKAASATLDQAGWTQAAPNAIRSRQGVDLGISLVTADAYPYRQVAEAVRDQLRLVGVEVKVQPVPAAVLVGQYLLGKKYQMALAAFDNGPDPDQYSLWHSGQPKGSLNFASTLTPKQALIDKDLEDGRSSVDRKARKPAYADFQQLIAQAAPAVFLYEPHYAYLVSKRVHGLRTNPVIEPGDRFQFVAQWYVIAKGG